jgi:DNA modification methylase
VRRSLRQLAGENPIGQQHEARWVHPFPARMPLSVAEHFVRELSESGALVLDPMVGSGTTAVATRLLGRRAVGIDRDPLALLISRVATTTYTCEQIFGVSERVLKRARRLLASGRVRVMTTVESGRFVEYWFPPEAQEQLSALVASIRKEPAGAEQDFAWLVFSSLIIAKSAGASWAIDISRSRPHKRKDKGFVLPFDAWGQRSTSAASRLPFRQTMSVPEARILHGDARTLPLDDASVDMVLTSPPYLSAIDYLRSHRFSLIWMGHSMDAIRQLRATMVGTERGLWTQDGLPPPMEDRLERVVRPERFRAQRRQYLSDLKKVLGEAARVLRARGLVVAAVGPSMLSPASDDAANVVDRLATAVGLRKVGSATRHLRAADRSLPFLGRGVGKALSRRMAAEVFVALRKEP